ncbi:MAG: preprotein translocase subunit YajC [Clostridia bacterium]|nr:preprotein translocase subunit YajC [Clostridia bacterium]
MFSNLLVDTTQISTYVILGVLIVAIIVMFVFSSKRRKKQEEEAKNLIDAVKPGNKVKTIGGICGIVVEVDSEENTFVLETGTEQSGKCFIKFDKQAIYQTDAVVEKSAPATEASEAATEEAPAEKVEEVTEEVAEAPVEEAPAETAEVKKAAKKSKKN